MIPAAFRGPALRAVLAAATAITGACNADREDAKESSRSSALVTLPDGGAAPPIIIASDISVEATHLDGTVVRYTAQATGSVGDCAGSGAPSCPSWKGIGFGITCGTARGLVIDPANSDVLYASADDRGWKSLDRGQTWSIVSTSLNPFNIAIAPSGELYAAARFSDGIFKSLNGGQTWTRILSGQSQESKIVTDPFLPGVLYVFGGAAGILKSEDAGTSWAAADSGLPAGIIPALAIDPATPTTLYAGHSDGSIFKTTDGGQSWQRLPTPTVAATGFIAVSPADPNIVATSTLISRDGGATWTASGVGPALSMAFHPADVSIAYATIATGVFKTVDGGLTWPRSDAGMISPHVRQVVLDRTDPTTLYVTAAPGTGNGAGVYLTRNGGASWSPSPGFQASTCRGTALAVSPLDSRIAYAAFDDAGLFATTDGGNTWHLVSRSFAQMVPANRVVSASRIGWVTVVGETVWAGAGGGIFNSIDRGVTWNFANPTFPSGVGQVIADEPATSSTLFAAAGSGILRSDDGGATWQLSNAGLPPSANVLALAIDPRPPFVIYALVRIAGVFRSLDHGQSWQADPGADWSQVEAGAIAIDSHTDPSTVVVLERGIDAAVGGTRFRLFRRADHGQPFTEINYAASSFFPGDTLVADVTAPTSRLYWPYAGGIQVSVDQGGTWTHLVGSTSLVHQPEKLVVAPSDGTIYTLYRGSSNLTPAIAWRTTNATDAPPTASVVQGAIQPRCSPGPGSLFPMGNTQVICIATDAFGQSTAHSFIVRVADTTPPVLSLPDTINERTEANGKIVTWGFGAEDEVSGIAGTPACSPPSGSFFLMGTSTVTCAAQDQAGNVAQGSFLVRVEPLGHPAGTPCAAPADCLDGFCVDGVCCDSACGGGVPGDCQACSIAAGATANGTCGPAAAGMTCYTAAAFCEADRVCSGTSLACPSPTLPLDECAPTTDDPFACDGEPACAELLGGTDTVGGMELTFLEPYEGEIRVEASGQGCPPSTGFEVLSMGATHGSGTYLDISAEPPTGNRQMKICIHYPQGNLSLAQELGLRIAHGTTAGCVGPGDWTQLIEAEPIDTVNNIICGFTDSLSPFAIFVPLDADGPTFGNVPATIVAYATSTGGAMATYTPPTATDAVDGPRPVSCAPAPGAQFRPGKTIVTCTAADLTGHTSTATFTVWVQYQAPTDGTFFLKPIRPDDSAVFRIGRPVPVRFRLTGASKDITDLVAKLVVTKISDNVPDTADVLSDETVDDTDFVFKYRRLLKWYAYRWKTRDQTKGTYQVEADLGDGVLHQINVSLKGPQ